MHQIRTSYVNSYTHTCIYIYRVLESQVEGGEIHRINSQDDSARVGRGGFDMQRDGDEPSRNEYAIHQIKTSCLNSNTHIRICIYIYIYMNIFSNMDVYIYIYIYVYE